MLLCFDLHCTLRHCYIHNGDAQTKDSRPRIINSNFNFRFLTTNLTRFGVQSVILTTVVLKQFCVWHVQLLITFSIFNQMQFYTFKENRASQYRQSICFLKVKVKVTLVQVLRLCTGRTTIRGSRGIALHFHYHGNRRDEGSASRPGRSLPPGKTRYPLYGRLGGPQGRSGQVRKI